MGLRLVPKKDWKGDTEYELKDSASDSTGALVLIAFLAFLAFLAMNAHWILMGIGGAAGAWLGEKATGRSIKEFDSGLSPISALIILSISLLGGGIGFVQGDNIRKQFNESSKTPQQAKPTPNKQNPSRPPTETPSASQVEKMPEQVAPPAPQDLNGQATNNEASEIPTYSEYPRLNHSNNEDQEDQNMEQTPRENFQRLYQERN